MADSSVPLRIGISLDMTWPLRRHIDIFAGIAKYAGQQENWTCIVDDFAIETLEDASRKDKPFDGIIARVTPRLAAAAKRLKTPLINVWFNSPAKDQITICPDNTVAGEWVGQHLLSRGVRRVLCLIRRGDKGERMGADAIAALMSNDGGSCDVIRISLDFARSKGQWEKTRALIENWVRSESAPAGLYAGVDILGRLAAQALAVMGFHVPNDVAIVAGFNEPTLCLYPEPALTSLEFGYDQIGFEAARLLGQLLDGAQLEPGVIIMPPRELVVRQSSDFVYVEEKVVNAAMQFIAANSHKSIGVEDVVRAGDVSRRKLETRFEQCLGRTVATEIRRVRIEQAKRLLAANELPVAEIAKVVGFGTNSQMARVFQRELGLSPRTYRDQYHDRALTQTDST
jgi:LacI family transcriptional regulator